MFELIADEYGNRQMRVKLPRKRAVFSGKAAKVKINEYRFAFD